MGRSVFNDPELLMNFLLDLLAEQEGTEIFDREIGSAAQRHCRERSLTPQAAMTRSNQPEFRTVRSGNASVALLPQDGEKGTYHGRSAQRAAAGQLE